MKLGGKKIKGGIPSSIIKELKEDKHSAEKKKFMKKAKEISKKHS